MPICANSGAYAHFGMYLNLRCKSSSTHHARAHDKYLRNEAILNKIKFFSTNIRTIRKNRPRPTCNFELKRLKPNKPKLDIVVEKPKNRVHKLTDSNGAPTSGASGALRGSRSGALFGHCSSCGFSSNFASLGRFYEFERSPLCAGTGDDPKGHAGD